MSPKKYIQPRKKIPSILQREIKVEANHSCIVCKERVSLTLHHIDGNRENNVSDNIVCICSNCHGMAHDGKISPNDFREYKKRAKQASEELLKLQKVVFYLTNSAKITVSSDFATLQLKYHEMLTRNSDKIIFYQCFIYLIPEFYIDQRGESVRQTVRILLDATSEEEEAILNQLIQLGLVDVTGGLVSLKDKSDAKVALSELITSGKLDIKEIIEKFTRI